MKISDYQKEEDGNETWWLDGKLHREDGPAIITCLGAIHFCLFGHEFDLEDAMNDSEFKIMYPELIESMLIYLVHNL
jgi:hypothetical protein